MSETKLFRTTDKAGWWVAGRKIPAEKIDGAVRPKVGHELRLTEAEAKYELLSGVIERPAVTPTTKRKD